MFRQHHAVRIIQESTPGSPEEGIALSALRGNVDSQQAILRLFAQHEAQDAFVANLFGAPMA